jgi:non-specific serine/threonine protein kinase
VAKDWGDYERALHLLAEARALFAETIDLSVMAPSGIAKVIYHMSQATYGQGDLQQATVLGEEALRLARSIDDAYSTSLALSHLGLTACERGDHARAAAALTECLDLGQSLGNSEGSTKVLANLAVLASACGQPREATRLFSAVTAMMTTGGWSFVLPETTTYDRMLDGLRTRMGDQAFNAAWDEGQAMTLDRAVEEARAIAAASGQPRQRGRGNAASSFGLTHREVEVLRLVVEGRSDQEIADALFISRRTASTHVSNLLAKLQVDGRTAATATAVRHGLV